MSNFLSFQGAVGSFPVDTSIAAEELPHPLQDVSALNSTTPLEITSTGTQDASLNGVRVEAPLETTYPENATLSGIRVEAPLETIPIYPENATMNDVRVEPPSLTNVSVLPEHQYLKPSGKPPEESFNFYNY